MVLLFFILQSLLREALECSLSGVVERFIRSDETTFASSFEVMRYRVTQTRSRFWGYYPSPLTLQQSPRWPRWWRERQGCLIQRIPRRPTHKTPTRFEAKQRNKIDHEPCLQSKKYQKSDVSMKTEHLSTTVKTLTFEAILASPTTPMRKHFFLKSENHTPTRTLDDLNLVFKMERPSSSACDKIRI